MEGRLVEKDELIKGSKNKGVILEKQTVEAQANLQKSQTENEKLNREVRQLKRDIGKKDLKIVNLKGIISVSQVC